MEQLLTEITKAILEAQANGGWMGIVGIVLVFVIRFYRLPIIQSIVPKRFRWDALTPAMKFFLPFGLAFAGTLLVSLAGHLTIAAAIAAAIGAGVAAMALHKGTAAFAKTIDMANASKYPMYEPGRLRKFGAAAGIMPPMDIESINRANDKRKKARGK